MKINEGLLREFYENGRSIRRTSWPAGDHIDTDGAEGGTIWYYSAENDDLTPDYRLGFHDLGTDEWEFAPVVDSAPLQPASGSAGLYDFYAEDPGPVGIVPRDARHHAELDATHRKHPDGSYFK